MRKGLDMTPEQAAELRKPFPPSAIGKLPRGGAKLDFVGHAAVTDRLLSVDPEWNWEPLAVDTNGLPLRDAEGALWVKVTICGVTRLGVSDPGDTNKVAIGDALRNAAMRFGVALDLWTKDDLESQIGQSPRQTRGPLTRPPATPGEHGHADKLADIQRIVGAWPADDPRRNELRAMRDAEGWPVKTTDYDRATTVAVWRAVNALDKSAQEIPGNAGAPAEPVPADQQQPQGALEVGKTEQEAEAATGGAVPDHQPDELSDGPVAPPRKTRTRK